MSRKIKLYNSLVNEVPGIRERYHSYKLNNAGGSKLKPLAYLGLMNFQYHVLRRKSLESLSFSDNDTKIRLQSECPESAIADYGTAAEFVSKLLKYQTISFDVFDTLVLRPFKAPTDLFFFEGKELKYPEFKKLRVQAEMKAREKKRKTSGNSEVNFDEVWEEVGKLTGIDAEKGKKLELSLEKKYCFANPFFVEVIRLLKEQNKKIIICSDMYLGQNHIKELLSSCGYGEFDEYFVSSDYEKSKADGSLYHVVKEKYGHSIAHVGDNRHSDVYKAKENGIEAIYYVNVNSVGNKFRPMDISPITGSVYAGLVNQFLHNGSNKKSDAYELGFIYGGLLVTGYCQFIHQYAKTNNIDKLLFLSRDGDVICKAYKRMYPDEADRCEYVLWSRLAAAKMTASYYKYHFMARMIDYKVNLNYSLESIFGTMDLSHMTDLFISEREGAYTRESVLNKDAAKAVKRFLENHWDEVLSHYSDEINEGRNYYSQILSGCSRALAIDAGWMGSGPLMLDYMVNNVWNLDCKITGILAGTLSGQSMEYEASESQLLAEELVSYGFSSSHNRDIWKLHDASKGHNLIVELLLSSDKPSFRGFKKDKQGSYSFNKSVEKIDSKSVQAGILDFTDLFLKHMGNEVIISGRDAFAPIMILYRNRKWVDKLVNETKININVE